MLSIKLLWFTLTSAQQWRSSGMEPHHLQLFRQKSEIEDPLLVWRFWWHRLRFKRIHWSDMNSFVFPQHENLLIQPGRCCPQCVSNPCLSAGKQHQVCRWCVRHGTVCVVLTCRMQACDMLQCGCVDMLCIAVALMGPSTTIWDVFAHGNPKQMFMLRMFILYVLWTEWIIKKRFSGVSSPVHLSYACRSVTCLTCVFVCIIVCVWAVVIFVCEVFLSQQICL